MKDDGTSYPFAMGPTDNGAKLNVVSTESIEAIEDLKIAVNKLSYVLNQIGIHDQFSRTSARNIIDDIQIKFNAYIKTLHT